MLLSRGGTVMHGFDFEKKSDDIINKTVEGENDMYRMIFHANPNVMLIVDPSTGAIVQANRAAKEFYGYGSEDILEMKMGQINEAFEGEIEMLRDAEKGINMFNVKSRLSDGTFVDAKIFSTPVEIKDKILLYIAVFPVNMNRDSLGEEHPMVKKYFQMALHDELTELPNKRFLKMKIEEEMKRADRENTGFALIFIDMDDFKTVNDRFGHVTGDKLLSMVGQRLKKSVRGNDFAARFGGDEFGVILSGIEDKNAACLIAKRIISCFENPFSIEENWIEIKCSMGMSVYPQDGKDFNELIRAADVEMYNEKKKSDMECISAVSCCARFYR